MVEWLRSKILPEAVRSGAFGKDLVFLNFEPDSKKALHQFSSEVVFGKVILENKAKQQVEEHIVVKMQMKDGLISKTIDSNAQFNNEVLFYTEIVPLFKKYDKEGILDKNLPEFVYGQASCGEKPGEDVIILKDLSVRGFKLTDNRLFIDENHVKLAMEKIAKFHALSYLCQKEEPTAFNELISKLKNEHFQNETIKADYFTKAAHRGIDLLQNDPEYKDKLDPLCTHAQSALHFFNTMHDSKTPAPVICHGDFTRNNMMFKYGSNGEPEDIVLFDFAMIVFTSPTVDLSILLMINTSPRDKQLHWDGFLKTYYDSLSSSTAEHPEKLSYDDIVVGMRKHGVFGYYVSCMFLPVLLMDASKEDFNKFEEVEEAVQAYENLGGDQACQLLSDLVKHMIDNHFFF